MSFVSNWETECHLNITLAVRLFVALNFTGDMLFS